MAPSESQADSTVVGPARAQRPADEQATLARHSLRVGVFMYLALVVVLPLAGGIYALKESPVSEMWKSVRTPAALSALALSCETAAVSSVLSLLIGLLLAWMLVRYDFPFRKVMDAMIDLPFVLPAVVAGISFASLYGPGGVIGKFVAPLSLLGRAAAFVGLGEIRLTTSFAGIVLAQVFVAFPYVVRTMQPVIIELDAESEDASISLGASDAQTFFRVILPQLRAGLAASLALAFTRAIGDYGMVVLVSGNIPRKTLLLPVYVFQRVEAFDYPGAAAAAAILLAISMTAFLCAYIWQAKLASRALL